MGKMKRFLVFVYVALVSLFCTSCVMDVQYVSVPFTVNDAYYSLLNNDKTVKGVYYSQSEFDRDFKPAIAGSESMGKLVDFSSSFVVTITDVAANTYRTIEITEILEKDMILHVKYRIVTQKESSSKMHPCIVASISRDYVNYDIAFHDVTDWE